MSDSLWPEGARMRAGQEVLTFTKLHYSDGLKFKLVLAKITGEAFNHSLCLWFRLFDHL